MSADLGATEIEQAAGRRRAARLGERCFWAVTLGSYAALLLVWCVHVWPDRPHYRFLPWLLLAVGWLLRRRWPRGAVARTRATWILGGLLLLVACGSLLASILLVSPWLGALAALLSLGGILLAGLGPVAWRDLAGPWFLLWLILPPPRGLDVRLLDTFQRSAAGAASGLLDTLHVDHLLAGSVFRLADRDLFWTSACGGVHSPLVLVAIAGVLAVLGRRSPLHAVGLLAASLLVAAVAVTGQMVLVVLAAVHAGVDLAVGWPYTLLGYSALGLGGLLLVSADQLLRGLCAPVLVAGNDDADLDIDLESHGVREASDPLSRLWNRLVSGTNSDRAVPVGESHGPT